MTQEAQYPEKAEFLYLVMMLASSASVGLGDAPDPAAQKPSQNLPQARFSIDLLGILQEKTKGNLTPEESRQLEGILSALRLRYVEVQSS